MLKTPTYDSGYRNTNKLRKYEKKNNKRKIT